MLCQELTFAAHTNLLITIAEHQALTEAKNFKKIIFLYICVCVTNFAI